MAVPADRVDLGDEARFGVLRKLGQLGLTASAPAIAAGESTGRNSTSSKCGSAWSTLATGLAIGLYGASLTARTPRAGRRRLAGLPAVSLGGVLGGHISFRLAGGANHAEPIPHLLRPGWHYLATCDELPDSKPVRKIAGEVPAVAVRTGDQVHVLADRCRHMSGPCPTASWQTAASPADGGGHRSADCCAWAAHAAVHLDRA